MIGTAWSHPDFPNLANGIKTSDDDEKYNCTAFAAGDTERYWDPNLAFSGGGYYWPPGAKKGRDLASYIDAFEAIGYEQCADGELDSAYEKIVLYADDYGYVHHVARQLSDGKWTSKLGNDVDISHPTPDCLISDMFGKPARYMRRPIK